MRLFVSPLSIKPVTPEALIRLTGPTRTSIFESNMNRATSRCDSLPFSSIASNAASIERRYFLSMPLSNFILLSRKRSCSCRFVFLVVPFYEENPEEREVNSGRGQGSFFGASFCSCDFAWVGGSRFSAGRLELRTHTKPHELSRLFQTYKHEGLRTRPSSFVL